MLNVEKKDTNSLINESSPYLLQHAYNPVDWHLWNKETLAKAKREGKLILISIGYSNWASLYLNQVVPFYEIVIIGETVEKKHGISIKNTIPINY